MADHVVIDERAAWEASVDALWHARPRRLSDAWYGLSRNKLALAGAVLVVFFSAVALVGPFVAPYDYARQVLSDTLLPPFSPGHVLGTDELGRDVLSRLLLGIRISIAVGLGTTAWGAAGKVHTEIQRGFVRAEVIAWDQLVDAGGYAAARDRGVLRLEGRDYRMRDGDVMTVKFTP